jgi:N-acetylmuramic acid 6-phosphate (MurNAc-6-P) etherase
MKLRPTKNNQKKTIYPNKKHKRSVSRDDARTLLDAADGSVKVAIVMHQTAASREEALKLIADAGGIIRRVVGNP